MSSNCTRKIRLGAMPSSSNLSMTWFSTVVFPTCRGPRKTVTGARPAFSPLNVGANAHRRTGGNPKSRSPRHHGLLSRSTRSVSPASSPGKVN